MNILILIAQFWTTVWPVGYAAETPSEIAQGFFEAYLAMPIVIVFYVGFKLVKKTKDKRLKDIDITSGRREMDLPALLAEEREIMAGWPWWKRWWNIVF